MAKEIDKIKKQLLELADVVNEFGSEDVQVIVIERLLTHLSHYNKQNQDSEPVTIPTDTHLFVIAKDNTMVEPAAGGKKPGATKIIHQLLQKKYFDDPRTLAEVTEYINANFDSGNFYTYQTSGVLLGLYRKNKLARITYEESSSYSYIKPSAEKQ